MIQRRLLHGGRALRAGYVEGVGVRADHRRRGHASAMMEALERVIRDAYDLGALGATDDAARFYSGRGWRLWGGRLSALTPDGVRADARRGGRRSTCCRSRACALDLSGELTCDWRDGDVW